jgi:polyisoprenyl-teichoic acid--peptidoglycan teichoic acid transferase
MSLRKRLALPLVALLLLVSCSVAAVTTTTTLAPTTTTSTTLPSTTTTSTIPPMAVEGAPPELTAAVETFYEYASGMATTVPRVPDQVLATITPTPTETPRTGVASVATFFNQRVATVEMGGDLFLALDDGSGWRFVGGNWPSVAVPPYYGPTPKLVAVIGSDARPGEDIAHKLGDSIHIIGLDGAGGGGVLGIPRDSYVPIPGVGTRKITSALPRGGPDLMVATIESLTGLQLDGYVVTGFVGFQEMLGNVLGGVTLSIPFPINDQASGAYFAAGEQYLNGPAALAFARARKTVPGGDLTRSAHQGMILLAAAKTARFLGYGYIPQLMELSQPWMATDQSAEQLLNFAALTLASDLDNMQNVVAPGSPGSAGGASVVFLHDSAALLWQDLADGRLGS